MTNMHSQKPPQDKEACLSHGPDHESVPTIGTVAKDTYEGMIGELDKLESKIKDNPIQSVGIAFVSGLLLSYLLKRR